VWLYFESKMLILTLSIMDGNVRQTRGVFVLMSAQLVVTGAQNCQLIMAAKYSRPDHQQEETSKVQGSN
jgi:hypothetical protein